MELKMKYVEEWLAATVEKHDTTLEELEALMDEWNLDGSDTEWDDYDDMMPWDEVHDYHADYDNDDDDEEEYYDDASVQKEEEDATFEGFDWSDGADEEY